MRAAFTVKRKEPEQLFAPRIGAKRNGDLDERKLVEILALELLTVGQITEVIK